MVCPSAFSFILYNPVRLMFTDREAVLRESEIQSDSFVLEAGAGNGFFTEVLVRNARQVFAVELQAGMVEKLRKRLSGARNLHIVRENISETGLPFKTFDVAFLYYTFHEFDNKEKAAENIGESIKAGGILSIYEPTIEVGRKKMKETVRLFGKSFEIITERAGLFTRFVKLRKRY